MITIALLAILLGVAAPNLTQMLQNQAASSSAEALVADLRLARSEAVKRGQPVTLCGMSVSTSAQGATTHSCTTGNGAWADGWMITNPAGAGAPPLKVQERQMGIAAITPANASDGFTFNPSGILAGGNWARVVITTNNDNEASTRAVCINAAGKGRIVKGSSTCQDAS